MTAGDRFVSWLGAACAWPFLLLVLLLGAFHVLGFGDTARGIREELRGVPAL